MTKEELKDIQKRELAYQKSRLDYFDTQTDDKKPSKEIRDAMKAGYDDLDKKAKEDKNGTTVRT